MAFKDRLFVIYGANEIRTNHMLVHERTFDITLLNLSAKILHGLNP